MSVKKRGSNRKVDNFMDVALLLDPNRVMEASKEFGEYYNSAYDHACKYALECVLKKDKAAETIERLNGVIKEQEDDINRLEHDIKQVMKEFEDAKDDFSRGQLSALKCCLEILNNNQKGE